MRLLAVLVLALVAPALAPMGSSASGPSIAVSMDAPSHSTLAAAQGDLPVATVSVVDGDDVPMAGAQVAVHFIRVAPFVGFVAGEQVTVTTGEDGTATASPTLAYTTPGNYVVYAIAFEKIAETKYSATL